MLGPELRFTDRAVLLGGAGARTSLHADHANWTGWNALFAGKKLWRFFPPTTGPRPNKAVFVSACLARACRL